MKAFDAFVESHSRGTSKKDRQELYRLRSAISHGGRIMGLDEDPAFAGLFPLSWDQHALGERLQRVCQISLVNHLLVYSTDAHRRLGALS